MKHFSRKLLAILLACVMTMGLSATAFAAEPVPDTTSSYSANATQDAEASAFAFDVYGDFVGGTKMKSCPTIWPGTYTLYYSVTAETTLYLWVDAYTSYSYTVSNSGEKQVKLAYPVIAWNVSTSAGGEQSYSFIMD